MQHRFCPTFTSVLNSILKLFPKCKTNIVNSLTEIMVSLSGDKYPGFGINDIRKDSIGLPEYKFSKSKGLRFIYLFLGEKKITIPIHIYKKGAYKKEAAVKTQVKKNLIAILSELTDNCCHENSEALS